MLQMELLAVFEESADIFLRGPRETHSSWNTAAGAPLRLLRLRTHGQIVLRSSRNLRIPQVLPHAALQELSHESCASFTAARCWER